MTRLARSIVAMAALGLLACGDDGGGTDLAPPVGTVVDEQSIEIGPRDVDVTLARRTAGPVRVLVPAGALAQPRTVVLRASTGLVRMGGNVPTMNVLQIATRNVVLAPMRPARVVQAAPALPLGRRYVVLTAQENATSWTVTGIPVRRSSLPVLPEAGDAAVSNESPTWEYEVTGSGTWAIGLVDDAGTDGGTGGPDGGAQDAGAPDASTGTDATAGEVDAATTDAAAARAIYVGTSGLAENAGTQQAPLRSIAAALARAMPGDTVWLLDGVYDNVGDPRFGGLDAAGCGGLSGIDLPAGVTLAAVNPGAVTISVSGSWGLCLKGGTIKNIRFRHLPNTGRMVEALEGDNVIEGATFENAYCSGGSGWEAAVSARNQARLTLRPGGGDSYLVSGCQFVGVWEQAEVTIEGGSVIGGTSVTNTGAALVIVRDQGKLTSKGTTFTSTQHQNGFSLAHRGTLALDAGTVVRGFSQAGIRNGGEDTRVQATGATFEGCGSGITLPYGYTTKMTAMIRNSTFKTNTNGISTGFGNTLDLVLEGTQLTGNTNGATLLSLGTVKITGSEFSGNTGKGLEVAPQNACKLELRESRITNNGGAGLNLNCNASSVIDLGTLASAGGNVFTGNVPSVSASAGLTIDAIGNTWTPSAQAANAEGRYTVAGAGAVLEVTGGTGPNYQIGTSKMRLAQNP